MQLSAIAATALPSQLVEVAAKCRPLEVRLASLRQAMRELCATHGLDYASVAELTGVEEIPLPDGAEIDPQIVAEYLEMYGGRILG